MCACVYVQSISKLLQRDTPFAKFLRTVQFSQKKGSPRGCMLCLALSQIVLSIRWLWFFRKRSWKGFKCINLIVFFLKTELNSISKLIFMMAKNTPRNRKTRMRKLWLFWSASVSSSPWIILSPVS